MSKDKDATDEYWSYMQWAASHILSEPLPNWNEWIRMDEETQIDFLEYYAAHPYENLSGHFIEHEIQSLCDDVIKLVKEKSQ